MGDTISWVPYCEEFRKKHNCEVVVSTFLNHLFEKTYPNLKFVKPSDVNFDVNNNDYKNIKFVRFTDVNLLEFDETGYNKYIKNEYEKHK